MGKLMAVLGGLVAVLAVGLAVLITGVPSAVCHSAPRIGQ
jgi:hypothetical protein